MKRKFVSIATAALIAVTGVALHGSHANAQQTKSTGWLAQQAPGFYRYTLGDFRVTVLTDGTAPRDLPKIMSDPKTVRAEYDASHQALPVSLSINAYLVDTGTHRILVDTGPGSCSARPQAIWPTTCAPPATSPRTSIRSC